MSCVFGKSSSNFENIRCEHDWCMSEDEGVKDCIDCKITEPMTLQDYEDCMIDRENFEIEDYLDNG